MLTMYMYIITAVIIVVTNGGDLVEAFGWQCFRNTTFTNITLKDPIEGNQIISMSMTEPPLFKDKGILTDLSYLVFTNHSCELDLYFYGYWADVPDGGFVNHDQVDLHCTPLGTDIDVEVSILRVGDNNDHSIVKPDHPLPARWLRSGVIVRFHFDQFTFVDGLVMNCQPSYFGVTSPSVSLEVSMYLRGCPEGKYGGDCSQNCVCKNGGLCHEFNGDCFCEKGWTGDDCSIINPTVEISQTPQQVFYTGNVTLTCTTYMMTPKVMTWVKGDEPIRETQRQSLQLVNDVLILEISGVHQKDKGDYKCIIEDIEGKNHTKIYKLTPTDLQHFIIQPEDLVDETGSNVTLHCGVANRVGQLFWYVDTDTLLADGADVILNWAKGRFSVDWDDTTGKYDLHIQNVKAEDDREYHCMAGPGLHQNAIISKSAQVTVLEKANAPVIEEAYDFASLAFVADVPFTVTCRTDNGNPPASIKWYINGELVTENVTTRLEVGTRNRMNTVSVITLHPKRSDKGSNVTCQAMSEILRYEEQTSVTLVEVKYKPRVEITYSPRIPKEGDDVISTCHVDANPNNVTSLNWTIDGQPLSDFHGNTYTINDVKWRKSPLSVTCSTENDVGVGSSTIQVDIAKESFNENIVIGALAVIISLALVVAAPIVTYRSRHRIQQRITWYFGSYEENDGMTFDGFVYYYGEGDSKDEEFVRQTLIPELERDGKYLICDYQRNFIPGVDILTNIMKAIEKSRRTILILSPSFIEDDMCRFVFLKAQEEMLRRKSKIIIPISVEDISEVRKTDANIDSLLKEISYDTWPGIDGDVAKFWNNLKYVLPKKRPQKRPYVVASPIMLDPN